MWAVTNKWPELGSAAPKLPATGAPRPGKSSVKSSWLQAPSPWNRSVLTGSYWSWLPLLQLGTRWSKADQNLPSVLCCFVKNQGLHEPHGKTRRLEFRPPTTHRRCKTPAVCPLPHTPLLNLWNKSRKKEQSNLIFVFAINFCIYPPAPSHSKIQIQNVHNYFNGKYFFSSFPHFLWCIRWWLLKRWKIRWRVTRRRIRGPHIAGRWRQGLGVVGEARRSGGWKHTGMLQGDSKKAVM